MKTHLLLLRRPGPSTRTAAGLLIAALAVPSSLSHAQPAPPAATAQEEGRLRFKRGVDLFNEGDFRAALVEFKRAYEIAPSYRILFNLGQTSYELQDYAGALQAFTRYLKEGGAEVPADRRELVEREIKKLQGRVAYLTIEVNEAGALISVDDVQVGTSPLAAPLLVSAGQRRVSASKASWLPASQAIEVAGGDQIKLHLDLVNPTVVAPTTSAPTTSASPPATSAASPPPTAPATAPSTSPGPALWVSLGATVLLAGGSVATGLMARSAEKDRNSELARFPADPNKLKDHADRARAFALTADILGGLALLGAGVTVYFAVRPGGGTTTARVTPGGASLSLVF